MIIDSHTHIYPGKIAQKASVAIGDFYSIPMEYDGTPENLLKEGKAAGIDKFLVHSVATTPLQVESINNFIISEVNAHPDEFIGFGTIHPDVADPEKVFCQLEEGKLHGIKLHPDFQKFAIDDEKMDPIYKMAEGRYPILFHTGDQRYAFSNPERISKILKKFPDLQVICAHFGGYSEWDKVRKAYEGYNVYVDTSSALFALEPEQALGLIDFFGEDKVLFGTDYPMWDAKTEINRFKALGLSSETEEKILSKNLLKLLKTE